MSNKRPWDFLTDRFRSLRGRGRAGAGFSLSFPPILLPCLAAFLVAALLGWGADLLLQGRIESAALGKLEEILPALAKIPPRSVFSDPAAPVDDFAALNPFRVTGADPKGQTVSADPGAADPAALILVGTLPRIGAWIRDESGVSLVLRNQAFRGWRLAAVGRDQIILERERRRVPLFLCLSGGTAPPAAAPATPSAAVSSLPPGVQAAGPGGKEGRLPRELLNKLLMNPYDELAKIRFIPVTPGSGDAGGAGMKVVSIAEDSLLSRLGVQEGDMVQSLNGVPIRNLADVSNAVNSLLGGTRMDVTVMRGDKPENLNYAVQ
jgi:hypothetical protein